MTAPTTTGSNKKILWISWVLSAIPVGLMLFSAAMKIVHSPQVVEVTVTHLGYPERLIPWLAALEPTCVAVYVIPQTAVMGAILMTGYLGGAITTCLRVGDPFIVQVFLAVSVWGGLYLREDRLQALLPFRTRTG